MKKIIFLLTIGVLCFVNINEVSATSGYLKSDSIKTCNGVTYGKHGDGHWHVAIKNDDEDQDPYYDKSLFKIINVLPSKAIEKKKTYYLYLV